ncbi:MAG: hypothetical protein K6A34_06050 [Methanobrevibacter sp.]|nr:hypothetical protein [Methanobrevibacter sp.]
MIEIQLETNNQLLKRLDKEIIVNKSRNIIKAKFTIEGEVWDDVDKFAIFTDAFDNKTTVHLGTQSVCECVVPASCLETNYFKITIYGGDLIVTNAITIPLVDSGYSRHHTCDVDTGKDIFVEIFDSLKSKIDNIIFADNCLHIFSNGSLIESVSLPYVDEVQVRSIIAEQIQEYFQTDELNRFLKEQGYINRVRLVGDELIFE